MPFRLGDFHEEDGGQVRYCRVFTVLGHQDRNSNSERPPIVHLITLFPSNTMSASGGLRRTHKASMKPLCSACEEEGREEAEIDEEMLICTDCGKSCQ